MSRCNKCVLKDMERRAADRGVSVVVEKGVGVYSGWMTARYSDAEKPVAGFMELAVSCECTFAEDYG